MTEQGTAQVALLSHCFEQACERRPDGIAVVCGSARLTYAELDRRANQLAHLLRKRGVRESSPVGILLERSVDTYVALLGVLKAGAAYVPMDPSFPADRVAHIAADAGLSDLITTSTFHDRTGELACPVLELDQMRDRLFWQPETRPEIGVHPYLLCCIIYTSGATGPPTGVACTHANIVNFLRVTAPIYGVTGEDRVYQGLSIAVDRSVEEIWPAWVAGATLVAGPCDHSQPVGPELARLLNEHRITVFCCVPTLLTTLDEDVPSLRLLVVNGEACPADQVRRWARPGLRMLTAYGQTETSVTAICGELRPDRPVTLGRPIPTSKVYIVDERLRRVAPGEIGELCIGGPGVALGYVNRPELTAERFVLNRFVADWPHARRLYRSGDAGRFTDTGEIEYLGRIDTEVGNRGHGVDPRIPPFVEVPDEFSLSRVEQRPAEAWQETRAQALHQCFERTCDLRPDAVAVVCGASELTYRALDRRANRLAGLLAERGCGTGSTVGILLERSIDTYVALLGVLKSGAAYVPVDPSFPPERLAFIVRDAGLHHLVTRSESRDRTQNLGCRVLELDRAEDELAARSDGRPDLHIDPGSASYVIYTSGSTGTPKGVAISHASIVNFLRVATPIYGVTSSDRVYQGMSISFDFHLEEMWPAWVAGATLVAGPTDSRRFGQGLTDFLTEHAVTVLCSVPTLLTTVETDPTSVRLLLVSGEPMPADLVRRWSRPGRRILNAYGPTETTVSSSCAELRPDRPVTLGTPFPTYRFYVLDEQMREVRDGETGEICIGGPGVGIGYLNRPELTSERFVPNPIHRHRAEAPRIYRTGDLGRRASTGDYEYLGRIDTQVKIRGYRIELGEIEELIREDTAVENAVVTTLEREGAVQDLVGYVTLHPNGNGNGHGNGNGNGARELRERLHGEMRRRLPPYMIPSFIEVLDSFPLLAADKVNRAALPAPTSPPLGAAACVKVPAEGLLETELAEAWTQVLQVAEVSVEADFFCDLGGHSLAAARLVSRLRERPVMRGLAIGDLYAHPTIRGLARYVEKELAAPSGADGVRAETGDKPERIRHSGPRVWLCGLAQLALLYGWILAMGTPTVALLYFVLAREGVRLSGTSTGDALSGMRGIDVAPVAGVWLGWLLVTTFAFPVLGGRLVMLGVRPGWYPLWGLTYLRFWFYGRVAALAPTPLLAGTPLLAPYLRMMGARIGRDCQLASAAIGLAKFVEIGDGASVGKRARIETYMVEGGWLRLAPVRIGAGSHIGTNTGVLAGAEIGENASVGHQSLVHADCRVPADEHWIGSPLRPLAASPALLDAMAERADSRRWRAPIVLGYAAAIVLLYLLPLLLLVPSAVVMVYALTHYGLGWAVVSVVLAGPVFVLSTCATLILCKRAVLARARPGIHSSRSAFGLRLWLSNWLLDMVIGQVPTIFCTLYVIPFLRALGLRMGTWCEVARPISINVDMIACGDQCFLAGHIVLAPAVYHRGCVALNPAELGNRGFVGNCALVPGGARMGDNSLLGVMSVPPADRPMDPETTWLGSPSFFLPRRQPSAKFPDELTYRPTAGRVVGRLFLELFRVFLPSTITTLTTFAGLYALAGLLTQDSPLTALALLPTITLALGLASTLLVVLLKWMVMGEYRPRVEPYWGTWVRGTELITGLYEAVAVPQLIGNFVGTPWIAPLLRLFGVRAGRRVWLNSVAFTEFDLVEIGDDAMIGQDADLATHLFEDRVMKMSYSKAGAGASVGSCASILYDAEASTNSFLDADSLVMKSEILPADSGWRGIPARPL